MCDSALALGLAAVPGPRPAAVAAIAAPERVYVSVADNKGKPVAGLTAADFKVAIDDREQEIQSVTPAEDPVSIVIITDRLGLDPAYSHFVVHRALSGFVKTVHAALPASLFALTTFDGPVVRVAGFSSPTGGFNRTLERLSTNATDAAMLDALVDACRVLEGATTERRAIFAVFSGYRRDTSPEWNDIAAMALWQSKASLWAIEVQSTSAARRRQRQPGAGRAPGQPDERRDVRDGRVGRRPRDDVAAHERPDREAVRDYVWTRGKRHDGQPPEGDRRPQRPARPRAGVEPAVKFAVRSLRSGCRHSARSVSAGSSRSTRNAGIRLATSATTSRSTATLPNVIGSARLTCPR